MNPVMRLTQVVICVTIPLCKKTVQEGESMKRITTILLAAALVLSMAACGGVTAKSGEMTKEEMLAVAEELSLSDMREDVDSNKAKASLYTGNVYSVSAYVAEIETNYVVLGYDGSHITNIRVYLPTDDLISLEEGIKITVVGEMGEYNVEEKQVAQHTLPYPYFNMENAFFVSDTYEITGTISELNMSLEYAMSLSETIDSAPSMFFSLVDGNGTTHYVDCESYSKGEVTILENTYATGDTITVTGKQRSYNFLGSWVYTIKSVTHVE